MTLKHRFGNRSKGNAPIYRLHLKVEPLCCLFVASGRVSDRKDGSHTWRRGVEAAVRERIISLGSELFSLVTDELKLQRGTTQSVSFLWVLSF